MKNLAIIPARGGSKRIPKKNIKDFLGKPIIAYSIEAALKSGLFDEVMVSTDDEEIARIAIKYGAKVPFMRSTINSNDFASTTDVLLEVLENYKMNDYKYACCIYPTAPMITAEILSNTFDKLKAGGFDSVFPIVPYSFPLQRSLKVLDGKVSMVYPEYLESRSQDLEKRFHDAGQFYWFSTNSFLEKKRVYTENSGYIELDELMVQDIDSETDWRLAELKFSIINEKAENNF